MLSGEGNAGKRLKTTIGLISKKRLCTCSAPFFFLYISLPLFCTTTTRNFQKFNLSLILETTLIQKQFPLSVFIFIDSLAASVLQDAGGRCICVVWFSAYSELSIILFYILYIKSTSYKFTVSLLCKEK